jgi:DNA invertase Pin-like site-specific DNA recombinase
VRNINRRIYGYIRVSSKDQNEARQIEEMKKHGVDERFIFIDKESGKNFERKEYQLIKRVLNQGDLLIVEAIDRFGRNYREILKEWREITEEIKADIKVLDMPLLDTTQYKDTLGNFVSDLVLQVLSFVAERERDNIRKRQSQGIAVAKAKGVKFGRPKHNIDDNFEKVYKRWKSGEITAVKAMELCMMKRNTFYRRVKEYEKVHSEINTI